MELKLWKINKNTKVNEKTLDEDTILKSEDVILSCELYEDDCIIMAKVITEKTDGTNSNGIFSIFVKTFYWKNSHFKSVFVNENI